MTTKAELKKVCQEALELSKPVAATAGTLAEAINKVGWDVRRDAIKRTLEKMVADGEAMVEYWPVMRNGYRVPKAVHYYAPRAPEEAVAADSFARFDDEVPF